MITDLRVLLSHLYHHHLSLQFSGISLDVLLPLNIEQDEISGKIVLFIEKYNKSYR